jgi:uncharacterized membrane protein YoaK (UPF0700 family)
MRLLLLIQFLLIVCLLAFSIIAKPSADPHGLMATVAAMIAVSAMACQYALLRLTLPVAPSTAVMTGNLTNAVLGLVDLSSRTQPLMESDSRRVKGAFHLLVGFFVGRVLATTALRHMGDWVGRYRLCWPPWPCVVLAGVANPLNSRLLGQQGSEFDRTWYEDSMSHHKGSGPFLEGMQGHKRVVS